jgi:methyl-accepting chemotaxis protein
LANGDLVSRIETPFMPTLEKVRVDFNQSIEKLESAMRVIAHNANGIAAGAGQTSAASDELARRTEQQAAAVEETAAALEEITQTVTDSARRAEEAASLVAQTKSGAEHSGAVVRKAVDAMGEIDKSSREISNIISVIDDIAFQTNLLALNAGVEAARAGDAGKGFAVVAQEVRELAQRSAKAAKEIKTLITTSSTQVKNGVTLVDETGRALETIVSQVSSIDANVAAIVVAAREQATGLKEINKAVNSMDQNTQQNAAMVEETTAASRSLANEAESLRELLTQFRFGQQSSVTVPLKRPDARPTASPAPVSKARAFRANGGRTSAAVAPDNWEEF